MIFYHDRLDKRLIDYGINVPLKHDRAKRTVEALRENFNNLPLINPTNQKLKMSDLLLAHNEKYIKKLLSDPRDICNVCYELDRYQVEECSKTRDFSELITKVLYESYTSYEAMKFSLQSKFSFHLGGGAHHAMTDQGRGFCLINDI